MTISLNELTKIKLNKGIVILYFIVFFFEQ